MADCGCDDNIVFSSGDFVVGNAAIVFFDWFAVGKCVCYFFCRGRLFRDDECVFHFCFVLMASRSYKNFCVKSNPFILVRAGMT